MGRTPALPVLRGCSQPVRCAGWAGRSGLLPDHSVGGSPCSDSDEEESTKEDNTALLRSHLKYEADVLFTRWAGPRGRGGLREVRPKMGYPWGGP